MPGPVIGGNRTAGIGSPTVEFFPSPTLVANRYFEYSFAVRSYREPLRRCIKEVIIPSIGLNFRSGGRPDTWQPLMEDTIDARAKQGIGEDPVLIRSGLLKRAATQLNIWTIDVDKAYVKDLSNAQGGGAWYGPLQQAGFTGGYGAVTPPRPFMLIQEQDTLKCEEVFYVWMEERMAACGFKLSPGRPA